MTAAEARECVHEYEETSLIWMIDNDGSKIETNSRKCKKCGLWEAQRSDGKWIPEIVFKEENKGK